MAVLLDPLVHLLAVEFEFRQVNPFIIFGCLVRGIGSYIFGIDLVIRRIGIQRYVYPIARLPDTVRVSRCELSSLANTP